MVLVVFDFCWLLCLCLLACTRPTSRQVVAPRSINTSSLGSLILSPSWQPSPSHADSGRHRLRPRNPVRRPFFTTKRRVPWAQAARYAIERSRPNNSVQRLRGALRGTMVPSRNRKMRTHPALVFIVLPASSGAFLGPRRYSWWGVRNQSYRLESGSNATCRAISHRAK